MRICCGTFLVICYMTMLTFAETITIDLAKQKAGESITLPAAPGEQYAFRVINRIPSKPYNISISIEPIPIPPFQVPKGISFAAADKCDDLLKTGGDLEKANDEQVVGKAVDEIRAGLGECKDPDKLVKIHAYLSSTEITLPNTYALKRGEQLTVNVVRDENKKWITILSTGPRGHWLVTYGASIVDNRDEKFFLRPNGDGKFTITPESSADDLQLVPSVYFSWLSRKAQLGNFAFGPTAGIGLSLPSVFGGVSLLYNSNLGFIFGASVYQQKRLSGPYAAGQIVSENLTEDQLHRKVFKPGWVVGITFRFGSNPFETEEKKAEAGTEKKTETPAEKKVEAGTGKKTEEAKNDSKK